MYSRKPFSDRAKQPYFPLLIILLFLVSGSHLQAQYCASNATSVADEEIFNVSIGTLNNSSTCSSLAGGTGSILKEYSNYAYAGFPGSIPNLDRGCALTFSVQIGTCGGNYNNAVAIYIDWNADLDFTDAGEQVYLSTVSTIGPHTETGTISIPVTATLGNTTMRVVNVETATPSIITPCGTYSWGETEDYFVAITNSGGVAPYVSSDVLQIVNGPVSQCTNSQQIICIPVVMGSGCNAGALTELQLGPAASTNLMADVSKIHIFYTGATNAFSSANEFVVGGTVPTANSNTITGSQTLLPNVTNYFWVAYDMNNASTIGNFVDASCNQLTIAGTNHIPTNTDPAGTGTIVICPCSFSLGSDLAFCGPFTQTLTAAPGYNSYVWSPGGATTPTLAVNTVGSYTCTATSITGGLVANGDFSAGDTGFSTAYTLGTGGTYGALSNAETYSVTNNPNAAHSNFYSFGDHTSGTGNMFVCNGSNLPNMVVWSQTITVTPNTNYNFSAWVTSVENTSLGQQAQIQFSINGSLIGNVFNAPLTGGAWANFFVGWNSGTATTAVITIVDQNTTGNNDFALDDINFERVCTFSDVIAINFGSNSTVSVPSNINVCHNGSVPASAFTSNPAGATFDWSSSNPFVGLAAGGTGNVPAFTAVNTNPAPVTTVITVTPSAAGCPGIPTSYTITVNPVSTLTTAGATICSGETATLTANASLTGGIYNWLPGSQSSPVISVSPSTTTSYTVTYSVYGCSVSAVSNVIVNPAPGISVAPLSLCEGQTGTLTAVPSTPGGTYLWQPSGETTSSILVNPSATSSYNVLYALNGCTASATANIQVNAMPVLALAASGNSISPSEHVIITASGGGSYVWSTGSTASAIDVNPEHTTTYCATVTTSGCSDVECLDIIVLNASTLEIPNVFTPNGDGVNDVFHTRGVNITTYNLNIFNRWGESVFKTEDVSKGWDGRVNGKEAPDGTYLFLLEAKGADDKMYTEKGHVTLIH
jgi:gliding motility-associated-like protein